MQKKYLLAPGPTPVPSEALLAMSQPIIHHRMPAFEVILSEVQEGLKYLECRLLMTVYIQGLYT